MLEVVIVVANGENGFPHLLHQRQQQLVKLATEMRVLIRRPLIKQEKKNLNIV